MILGKILNKHRIFRDYPFVYVDAGCSNADTSGFVPTLVHIFGEDLKIVGFDPLVSECTRLQEAFDKMPGDHKIEAAYLCSHPDVEETIGRIQNKDGVWNDNFWSRSWTKHCQDLFESGPENEESKKYISFETVYAKRHICLDEYFKDYSNVDFIKIDVDQVHNGVLRGCRQILNSKGVLTVETEANLQGYRDPTANTLFDAGVFLRAHNFSCFGIHTLLKYSRKHLPAPFDMHCIAQTTTGQIRQCDALFMRDLHNPNSQANILFEEPRLIKLLKLACIMEIYDLNDCAVEILLKNKEEIDNLFQQFSGDTTSQKLVEEICFSLYQKDYKSHILESLMEGEKRK